MMNPTPMAMAKQSNARDHRSGAPQGPSDLCDVDLGDDSPVHSAYELVRCQYLHASVVESHDGSALSTQCTTHGFGQSGVERDRLGRLDILVPVLEKPDDPVALAPGENELTGLAEALELLVCLDDLAERGLRCFLLERLPR